MLARLNGICGRTMHGSCGLCLVQIVGSGKEGEGDVQGGGALRLRKKLAVKRDGCLVWFCDTWIGCFRSVMGTFCGRLRRGDGVCDLLWDYA